MNHPNHQNQQTPTETMSLLEQIRQIDLVQAKRFNKLENAAQKIASRGIRRHLSACARMNVPFDVAAVREIIDDATGGRQVFAEVV